MKDMILGTGISGFIVAACLDKLNKDLQKAIKTIKRQPNL